MASISHKEVEHVAQLARLDLTEPEKTLFGEQLSQILTFVEQLQEVSTEGIPPTARLKTSRGFYGVARKFDGQYRPSPGSL